MIVRQLPQPPSLVRALAFAARQPLPAAVRIDAAAGAPGIAVAWNPVRVVRGDQAEELVDAWTAARAAWRTGDDAGIPVGIGYLGYELGQRFEPLRVSRLPPSPWPLIDFRFYAAFVRFRDDSGQAELCASDDAAAERAAAELVGAVAGAIDDCGEHGSLVELEPPGRHLSAVGRALDYIRAGDIYQVNLARRLGCEFAVFPGRAPGAMLFLNLSTVAPARYACWLADGDAGTALVGNSPERFLHRSMDGMVSTCPIKGTRARDDEGRRALLASTKDRAEHVMIVDLERNDLGRVCRTGTVEVSELCRVLALPTLFHLESTVRGRLRPEVGLAELLRATFPGGSVTGAPKIRAMQIIEELEPARRGPYTGATGWLGASGDLDLAVAIRTGLVRDGRLTLWVGGGVVADSDPASELAETWVKARAFIRTLG